MDQRISITDLKAKKKRGEKIVMMTCYDYPSARLLEAAGVDILFIGDTLGMVVLGYDTTIPVTMEEMLHHTKAVVRGSSRAHVLADMPFMSYQTSPEDALRNAGRLLKEGGAQSVKLEGGVRVAETVRFIVDAGIPVMGHIGLTPQSINQLGGYKVQGKTPAAAVRLINDAARSRAGRRVRRRPGVRSRPPRADDLRAPRDPNDRYRRGPALRRTGPGLPRPPRSLR